MSRCKVLTPRLRNHESEGAVPVPKSRDAPYPVGMHPIRALLGSRRRLGRPAGARPARGGAASPWLLGVCFGLTAVGKVWGQPGELAVPPSVERIAARGYVDWQTIDERTFLRRPGVIWKLYLEETTTGTVRSGERETPIRETRVRVALVRRDQGDELDLAYLQHLSNVEVAVIEPGDPRAVEFLPPSSDPENPWPNPAGFSFVETLGNVDLDDDDDNDILLRTYATSGDPRAHGILAISADEFGTPRIMALSEFVGTVRTEGLHLVDFEWPDRRMRDPIFRAIFLPAEDCRFLAQLGIRGEAQCEHCCSLPVYLQRAANRPDDRRFRPMFDRTRQGELLDRVRQDITLISAGDESTEFSSLQQAALGRVASFFFLTGSGAQARLNLEKALGARAEDFEVRALLDRIDAYFLQEE